MPRKRHQPVSSGTISALLPEAYIRILVLLLASDLLVGLGVKRMSYLGRGPTIVDLICFATLCFLLDVLKGGQRPGKE